MLETSHDTGELHQGWAALNSGLAVFNRFDRPDLVARADGELESQGAQQYGNATTWYGRAVADARAALGDERYDALAAEGATITWESYVGETIAHLDEFIEQGQAPERADC